MISDMLTWYIGKLSGEDEKKQSDMVWIGDSREV